MPRFNHVTEDGLRAAARQLQKSATGRHTLSCMADWLPESGCSLDERNQNAVFALICGAWGQASDTALEVMREAVEPVPA